MRECRKVPHPSRDAAISAAAAVAYQRGSNFGQLGAYRCRVCWMVRNGNRQRPWHFGHNPHRVKRSA